MHIQFLVILPKYSFTLHNIALLHLEQ